MTAYTTPAIGTKVRNIYTGREFVVIRLDLIDMEQGDGPELWVHVKGDRDEHDVWQGKVHAFEPVEEVAEDAAAERLYARTNPMDVVLPEAAAELTDGQIAAGAMVDAVNAVHATDLKRCTDNGAHLRTSRHRESECGVAPTPQAGTIPAHELWTGRVAR